MRNSKSLLTVKIILLLRIDDLRFTLNLHPFLLFSAGTMIRRWRTDLPIFHNFLIMLLPGGQSLIRETNICNKRKRTNPSRVTVLTQGFSMLGFQNGLLTCFKPGNPWSWCPSVWKGEIQHLSSIMMMKENLSVSAPG